MLGDFPRMAPLEDLVTQLEALWGGKTLATIRDLAARELNGTCFQALRTAEGPRMVLIVCVTGEHEIEKMGKLSERTLQPFGDWNSVSVVEAVARTMMSGGFAYDFDRSSLRSSGAPVVLIAAGPVSITKLESIFGLQP